MSKNKDENNQIIHEGHYRVKEKIYEVAKNHAKADNCSNMNEYFEKALEFYNGYISSNRNKNYLSNVVVSTVKHAVKNSESHMVNHLFRMAVEMSELKNLLAARYEISEEQLKDLHNKCIAEVKKLNGTLSFEEAIKWQK